MSDTCICIFGRVTDRYKVRGQPVRVHPSVLRCGSQVCRCNKHLLGLGQLVRKSLYDAGLIGYQFGVVGVRCVSLLQSMQYTAQLNSDLRVLQ